MGVPSDEPTIDRLRVLAHADNRFASSRKPDATPAASPDAGAPNLQHSRPAIQPKQHTGHDGSHLPFRSSTNNSRGSPSNGGSVNREPAEGSAPIVHSSAPPPEPEDTQVAREKPSAVDAGREGSGHSDASAATGKPPIFTRLRNGIKRFGVHTKDAVLHSYINILLIFVPVGIAANFANLGPEIVFAMNAIAIIPLAGVLTHATESVASRLGDTLGALLNVSFGNAVELIIFMYVTLGMLRANAVRWMRCDLIPILHAPIRSIALVKNEIRIVQASLLGSILANLLLILGMAFLFGGLRFQEQIYNNTVTQMSACLLSLSVMSLLLPTAFHASFSDTSTADRATLKISRGTSVVLLLVYVLYLLFQLKSHAYLYESMPQERIDEESHPGFLADILDSSTSSSSSSDSDETDTTSGSHTTAKRFRRAFRRAGRRKSSASSEKTPSLPSHVSSPANEINVAWNDSNPGTHDLFQRRGSHASQLHAIVSGDEADTEGDIDRAVGQPRVRDFEGTRNGESSRSPERVHGSEGKPKKKRRHHKKAKGERKAAKTMEKVEVNDQSKTAAAAGGKAPAAEEAHNRVVFSDEIDHAQSQDTAGISPSKRPFTLRQLSTKPTLPKMLTQNVFVAPPELSKMDSRQRGNRNSTSLRRTNSLPDRLNETQFSRKPLPPYIIRNPPPTERAAASPEDKEEEPHMSRTAAVVMLIVSTGLVALCAEFLVGAIPNMTSQSSVSQAFIGLIILPIVGNAAEHVTAVTVATKNKMDLAIGVAVGSSIQIALFVTPLVVILGWILNKSMSLYFNLFETISLFVTAFVVNFLVLDGKSNYLEGTLLIAAYVIIAVAAFFYPDSASQSPLGGSDVKNATTAGSQMLMMMLKARER